MATERAKIDFYAYGKCDKKPEPHLFTTNRGLSDRSNTLLERNALSLNSGNLENIRNNYRTLHTVNQANAGNNNYLQPLQLFNKQEKYGVDNTMTNMRTYLNTKEKYFAKDIEKPIHTGFNVAKEEFMKRKSLEMASSSSPSRGFYNKELKNNNLFFDKTNKVVLRYPKGHWGLSENKMDRTKISKEAPEWFHVVTDQRVKAWDEAFIKNGDTLSVFSRYNKWITVTPTSKDRRRPLEKIKIQKMEETSKIMPNWMQIKIDKEKIKEDPMRAAEYQTLREDKKMMVLVDKNLNNKKSKNYKADKSVFSIMDYRHNLIEKSDADHHMSKVNQMPKQFLSWNDDTVYHPKYKRDVSKSSIEKLTKHK